MGQLWGLVVLFSKRRMLLRIRVHLLLMLRVIIGMRIGARPRSLGIPFRWILRLKLRLRLLKLLLALLWLGIIVRPSLLLLRRPIVGVLPLRRLVVIVHDRKTPQWLGTEDGRVLLRNVNDPDSRCTCVWVAVDAYGRAND